MFTTTGGVKGAPPKPKGQRGIGVPMEGGLRCRGVKI